PFAEADNAESTLPLNCFIPSMLIHLIRACPLQFADQVTDANRRFDIDRQMHMRGRAVDAMQIHSLRLPAALPHKIMDKRFEFGGQQRVIIFGVPIDVEIDLMEDMARHASRPLQERSRLKPAGGGFMVRFPTTS